jgi:hypothetical protein
MTPTAVAAVVQRVDVTLIEFDILSSVTTFERV